MTSGWISARTKPSLDLCVKSPRLLAGVVIAIKLTALSEALYLYLADNQCF